MSKDGSALESARAAVLDEWRSRIGNDLASVVSASTLLRVSEKTMWRHVRRGSIPSIQLPDGSYRVPLVVLVAVTMPSR